MKEFIKFGFVGTIGFLVDASILLFFVHILEYPIALSRVFSFSTAVFATWLINRNFTFSKSNEINKKREYTFYLIIQTIGALINYIIFIILVYKFEFMQNYLILPLGFAAIIAMFLIFYDKKYLYNN